MKSCPKISTSLVLLYSLFLTGCGFLSASITSILEPEAPEAVISGQVGSGNGTLSLTTSGCSEVKLHNVDGFGHKTSQIAQTTLPANGNYKISTQGVNLKTKRYLLETICTNSLYQRFLTGESNQNLNFGTTLISWFAHTANKPNISSVGLTDLSLLYSELSDVGSLDEAYTQLSTAHASEYQNTTQTLATDLLEAAPQVLRSQVPAEFSEDLGAAVSVTAYHWLSTYVVFSEWKIQAVTLQTGNSWTFVPTRNYQGSRTLNILLGQENAGSVDTSKPYSNINQSIVIQNNYPAIVPNLTAPASTYTNQTALSFDLATGSFSGGIYSECRTFTSMAIEELAYSVIDIPIVNPALYVENCGPAPMTVNYTLSGIEGQRHIKVWARDSAGNISTIPEKFAITYDITNPVITFISPTNGSTLGRDTDVTLTWTIAEANPGAYSLIWFRDGENPITQGTPITCTPALTSTSTSCTLHVPDEALTDATFRLTNEDLAANTGFADLVFNTDVAPTAPVLTLDSAQEVLTNNRNVDLDVTYPGTATHIYYSTSPTTPALSAVDWEALSSDKTYTLPNMDGAYTIYAWVKNAVAVSSPDSVLVNLDRLAPILSSVSISGGAANTSDYNIAVRITGSDTSGVTHYCAISSTQSPASGPTSTGCIWVAITSTTTLDITRSVYLGEDAGQYYVYVWLKDSLDQVSTRLHDSIQYNPPLPGILNYGLASTSLAATYPPAIDSLFFTGNSTVYIKWQFQPAAGIPTGNYTISLEHSVDGVTFTQVNLAADYTNCSASVSAPFTHCYATQIPMTDTYHQFRIVAQAGILKSTLLTPALNLSNSTDYQFRILAGNTTLNLGEYSLEVPLVPTPENHGKSIAEDSHGNVYIFDSVQGILKFEPGTGVLSKIIKIAADHSYYTYNAPATDGSLSNPNVEVFVKSQIVVDKDDNLLVWDKSSIRKVDFTANTITTLVGANSVTRTESGPPQTGIPALDFFVDEMPYYRSKANFYPLPNGDILFRAGRPDYTESSVYFGLYKSATQVVDEFQVTGSFTAGGDTPAAPGGDVTLEGTVFKINPLTGDIEDALGFVSCPNGTSCTVASFASPIAASLSNQNWSSGAASVMPMHHELALVDNPYTPEYYRYSRHSLQKWNSTAVLWETIAGTGTVGTCDDSVTALSCNMDLRDVYVNPHGLIYLWDGSRIRRLNPNGTLYTFIGTLPSTGDSGPALSSRLANISTLDVYSNGTQTKVAFYENDTFKLRELVFNNNDAPTMYHRAGNGTEGGGFSMVAPTPLLTSSLSVNRLFYNPLTGEVFASVQQNIFKMDSTNWNHEFLGGGTRITDIGEGDGLLGDDIESYSQRFHYFDGNRALLSSYFWRPTTHGACPGPECSYGSLKTYDANDSWRQYNLAGGLGGQRDVPDGAIGGPDGFSINQIFSNSDFRGPFSWDGVENEFLMLFSGGNDYIYRYKLPLAPVAYDYAAAHATGAYERYAMNHNATGFASYRNAANALMVVYCTDNGNIYRKNLTAATAAVQIQPATSNFKCAGDTLRYNAARSSVVLSFTQNGKVGIAEIVFTP